MRTVHDTTRMQGEIHQINVVPAHKITFGIEQHLVRIDIGVVIRCRDCLRMIVVHSRNK